MNDDKLNDGVVAIAAAYVAANPTSLSELSEVVRTLRQALGEPANGADQESEELQPAVPIKKSVTPDYVVCLECGKHQKILKRHLNVAHGLTEGEYRQRWGLGYNHPLIAPNYSALRGEMAKTIGLGRKREASREDVEVPARRRRAAS